jgi:hypothetical protein
MAGRKEGRKEGRERREDGRKARKEGGKRREVRRKEGKKGNESVHPILLPLLSSKSLSSRRLSLSGCCPQIVF